MAMRVGFVGLGQMGQHMALNLAKSGVMLTVFDARPSAMAAFATRGVQATQSLSEIGGCDLVFLSLPNSEIVKKVLFADDGVVAPGSSIRIVVDTSTISYTATLDIAKQLDARGIEFIDAPVSGMEARAIDGTLSIMCGGKGATFDAVKPHLECMGNKILHMGDAGSGQLTKLINQLLFDINAAALAEILPMSVKMGLNATKVGDVVNSGTGRSYASEFFIPRILENSFSSGYPMKHAYKDLVSAAELCANLCLPMPILAAATTTYQTALLQGKGDLDKGAMICVFEELLGVRFRSASIQPEDPSVSGHD